MSAVAIESLKSTLESAFDRRAELTAEQINDQVRPAVYAAIDGLETGALRVAEPTAEGGWQVNQWLKKAVLLYFRVNDMAVIPAQPAPFWDKVEARFAGYDAARFRAAGVRVVPGAVARRGTYFGKDVVLMPSFTNIGAYVGEGTMVDTWATCASRPGRSGATSSSTVWRPSSVVPNSKRGGKRKCRSWRGTVRWQTRTWSSGPASVRRRILATVAGSALA